MQKSKDKNSFIKKPEYPGGKKAMNEFIRKNLKYPEEALKKKIEGKVHLSYTINFKGKVEHIKILNGLGYGCDEEAIRIVKLLEFTSPKNRGMRVSGRKKITINFKLPKVKKQKIQYSLTKKPEKKGTPDTQKKTSSYTYTIKW